MKNFDDRSLGGSGTWCLTIWFSSLNYWHVLSSVVQELKFVDITRCIGITFFPVVCISLLQSSSLGILVSCQAPELLTHAPVPERSEWVLAWDYLKQAWWLTHLKLVIYKRSTPLRWSQCLRRQASTHSRLVNSLPTTLHVDVSMQSFSSRNNWLGGCTGEWVAWFAALLWPSNPLLKNGHH